MELFEGHIISAPFLRGTAKVKKFERKVGYYLLEVILLQNLEYKSLRIFEDQLNQIKIESSEEAVIPKNSEDFFFWIEANILRVAYHFLYIQEVEDEN